MSVIRVKTIALHGAKPIEVNVEAHISRGIPAFSLVGLPNKTITEARERIWAMFDVLGLQRPMQRVTVNLTPADLPKEGSHYDVPIALALLVAMEVIEPLDDYIALGELSLDGKLLATRGVLPAAIYAESRNLNLICPQPCGADAAWCVDHSRVVAPYDLLALINHLKGIRELPEPKPSQLQAVRKSACTLDDVEGQEDVKRALKIACAGGHHILMIGPPGVGKSMIAKCMADLMPPLTPAQSLETSMIYSVSDQLARGIVTQSPFRSPHHTSSIPGLVGGGSRVVPGEVSLAHNGVLFLDELAEFDRRAIESLRLVLETGEVSIVRAQYRVTYPARFLLIAAMNPCKCGNAGVPGRVCKGGPKCSESYMSKLSGPILDRFDMVVRVNHPGKSGKRKIDAEIRAHINSARKVQGERFADQEFRINGHIPGGLVSSFVKLPEDAQNTLDRAVQKYGLSLRGRDRVMRVAQTIADLKGDKVGAPDVLEALGYRQEIVFGGCGL